MDKEPTIFSILLESIQAVMSIAGFIGRNYTTVRKKQKFAKTGKISWNQFRFITLGNAVTYVLLLRHQVSDMTPIVRHLLRHQALVDALICIMATIHIIQPVMFTIGNSVIDFIICQCWHRYNFIHYFVKSNINLIFFQPSYILGNYFCISLQFGTHCLWTIFGYL